MLVQVVAQTATVDVPVWQLPAGGFIGRWADPAFKSGAGLGALLGQLIFAPGQLGRFLLGKYRIGRLATATGQLRAHAVLQQAILLIKVLEQSLFAFDRISANPRLGRGLAHVKAFDPAFGGGTLDGRVGQLDPRLALVAAGHLLLDADHLLGHVIAIQRAAIRPANGEALQADHQLRVRQFTGRDCRLRGGLQLGRFSRQRRSGVLRQAQGIVQGQRIRQRRPRQHAHHQGAHVEGIHGEISWSVALRVALSDPQQGHPGWGMSLQVQQESGPGWAPDAGRRAVGDKVRGAVKR